MNWLDGDLRSQINHLMFTKLVVSGLFDGLAMTAAAFFFGLSYRLNGFFDFGLAFAYTSAAYAYYVCVGVYGAPAPLGLLAAVGTGVILSVSLSGILLQHLGSKLSDPTMVLAASLGVAVVGENILLTFFGDGIRQISSGSVAMVVVCSTPVPRAKLICAAFSVPMLIGAAIGFHAAPSGIKLRAMASDRATANLLGMPLRFTSRVISCVAGCVLALTAISRISDTGLRPGIGGRIVFLLSVVGILGGFTRPIQCIVVSSSLGILSSLLVAVIPLQWAEPLLYILMWPALLLMACEARARGGIR